MKGTKSDHSSFIALAVTASAFILYLNTLAPTVIWGDSAKLTIFVHHAKLSIRQGHHPLHTILGLLFSYLPLGDYAYRQNLMSACFGALTVGLVYLILFRWTRSVIAAVGGALALTVSHVFWLLSVINESYTLFAFFLSLIIWLMTVWDDSKEHYLLYLAAFALGLSLSNSFLMPFLLPGFVYFYLSAENRPRLGKREGLFVLLSFFGGAAVLAALTAKSLMHGGHDFRDLLVGGPFRRFYRSPLKILREVSWFPAYLMYQYPVIGFIIGFVGARHQYLSKRRRFTFLFILLSADLIFASGYMRQRQFFLLIASFIVFALWIGIGIAAFSMWAKERLRKPRIYELLLITSLLFAPMAMYYSIPIVAEKLDIDLVKARSLPYRENTRFFLVPDKHKEYGAQQFGREVFQILEPNSIIVADFTPIAVLRYFQEVQGLRKDVWLKLVDFKPLELDFVDRYIYNRPIYLADDLEPDYNIAGLQTKYNLVPVGPIFKVVPRKQQLDPS